MRRQRQGVLVVLALLLALLSPVARADAPSGLQRLVAHSHDASPQGRVTVRPADHLAPGAPTLDALPADGSGPSAGTVPLPEERSARETAYPGPGSATVRGPPGG